MLYGNDETELTSMHNHLSSWFISDLNWWRSTQLFHKYQIWTAPGWRSWSMQAKTLLTRWPRPDKLNTPASKMEWYLMYELTKILMLQWTWINKWPKNSWKARGCFLIQAPFMQDILGSYVAVWYFCFHWSFHYVSMSYIPYFQNDLLFNFWGGLWREI